jgi:hypothetical protein
MSIQKKSLIGNRAAAKHAIIATGASTSPVVTNTPQVAKRPPMPKPLMAHPLMAKRPPMPKTLMAKRPPMP